MANTDLQGHCNEGELETLECKWIWLFFYEPGDVNIKM